MREQGVYEEIEYADIPAGETIYQQMDIFTQKFENGVLTGYKCRAAVNGSRQTDAGPTYASTLRLESMRMLGALAVSLEAEMDHSDISVAFLNAWLSKPRYVRTTEGKYWKVFKAIYGWLDASNLWERTVNPHLKSMGYEPLSGESCIYVKRVIIDGKAHVAFAGRYVDDFVHVTKSKILREAFVPGLRRAFVVTDLGPVR